MRSALWDAAGGGARLSNWTPASTSSLNNVPPDVLVRRAEDLHRNNPWARLAVDCLTHNTVQAGIKPHPQIADPAMRGMVQREWARWTDQTDFNGRHDFYGFQQAVLRSVIISGEAIVRLVLAPDQRVPLQLQLLGREFLDNSRVDSRTLNGIRYDDAGRRVSYWLFQKHPATAPNMLSVEVPADQVIHVYAQDRAGQERGVPWRAPAMLPLRELQEYLEASLVKQKIAALMTAFITTQDGVNPLNGTPGQPPTLEPGAAVVLQPGQDVEIATPPPAADFEPFVRQQLRAIARALGIPYELLSGDVSQVTFASGRHSLLEFRRHLESIQDHTLVHQVCRPVWLAWVRMATITGVLPGAAEQYADVRWICPQIEMLNPKDETQNMVAQVRAGFVSRSEMVARSGWDAEQIDAEIAADNARADRLGLVLDSDPRRTTVQGQSHKRDSVRDVIGTVEAATIQNGRAIATIRFSDRDDVAGIRRDTQNGILKSVSVGYEANYRDLMENGNRVREATSIVPREISVTPLGAVGGVSETEPAAQAGELERGRAVGFWRGYRVACAPRRGIAAATARSTPFTISALLNTRATSGSSITATAPGAIRAANRLGFDFV